MQLITDIRDALPLVQALTLVLHPPSLRILPVASVREFVELIPGAKYREVSGNSANSFALDTEEIAGIVEEFVTGTAPGLGNQADPGHRSVHRPGRLHQACSAQRGPSLVRRARPPATAFSLSSPGLVRAFAMRNR
jgi:hypothetical protein